jgi:AraC-like DNA-binding protein
MMTRDERNEYHRRRRRDPAKAEMNERQRARAREWKRENAEKVKEYKTRWDAARREMRPPKPPRPLTARQIARAAGATRYIGGACAMCHGRERMVSNAGCAKCLTEATTRRQRANGFAAQKRFMSGPYKERPETKLRRALRRRFKKALARGAKVGRVIRDLGCTISELKDYIAAQFEIGMSWDNYGQWHLDHKLPLARFDLSDRQEFLRACHYTNLQPLWARDNWSKGARSRQEDANTAD